MKSRTIPVVLVCVSVAGTIVMARCTPSREENDMPAPVSSSQAQSESPDSGVISAPSETTSQMPDADTSEPVSVRTDSSNLYISNNSSSDIYFEAFPQELLAVIEWAPCDSPEKCQDKLMKPKSEISISNKRIAGRDTMTITVFWWNLVKVTNEERYEVINLNFTDLSIDK